ncbi:MAG: hypothetical protein ACQKBY_09700 [Verrucomicrobiales bacterium]
MNEQLLNRRGILIPLSFCAGAALSQGAVMLDDFDSYPGGGSGWAGDWSNVQGTPSIETSNPLNGGGSYLSFTRTNTNQGAGIRRSIASVTAAPYQVSFDWRYDSPVAQFNAYNDRISIGVNDGSSSSGTGTEYGTNTSWGWIIGVVGGDNTTNSTPYNDGEWYFYDNGSTTNDGGFTTGNMRMTGVQLADGVTYSFVVDVDPTAQTYDVRMTGTDGTNVFQAGMDFRNQTSAGSTRNQLTFSGSNTGTGEAQTWSLDNLVVTPEPGSALLCLLGALVGLRRRR